MTIPLYWWTGKPNFGDLLSEIVVRHVSGKGVTLAEAGKSGKLLAIGSVLDKAKPGDRVWGAGFLRPGPVSKAIHVHAVRGPLSRQRLLEAGIDCPEVYGDPGLLVPRFYSVVVDKTHDTLVLPHHSDWKLKHFARREKLPMLSVARPPLEVIDAICSARRLITSSLHGLVIAEAYGVPAILWRDGGQTWEPHFKFRDYFTSTGRDDPTVFDLPLRETAGRIDDFPKPVFPDLSLLISSFPKDWP